MHHESRSTIPGGVTETTPDRCNAQGHSPRGPEPSAVCLAPRALSVSAVDSLGESFVYNNSFLLLKRGLGYLVESGGAPG